VFLTNYYSVFDDDHSKIIFAPRKGTTVFSIDAGTAPSEFFNIMLDPRVYFPVYFFIALVVVTGTLFGALYGVGILKPKSKKPKDNDGDTVHLKNALVGHSFPQ
jgi:hypothetical protein